MELFNEIIAKILSQESVQITFPNLNVDLSQAVESSCYCALQKIKAVIQDDSLSDAEYFMKIEEIIIILEELGSSGGFRHDFG